MSVGYYSGCCPDPRLLRCVTSDVWDPYYPFPTIQQEAEADATVSRWKETEEGYCLTIRLPGAKKEDVRVKVETDAVLISAKMKTEIKEEKNGARFEKSCIKEFSHRFPLPENVKAEEVKAKMEEGVLTVTAPNCKVVKVVEIV